MDIEDCIEYASDVINVDEARTELADMRAKLEQWPVKWKASIDSYSNLLRESQEEITRLKAALNYIAAHGMGSSNDGAVHLGEHAYKALYPAIDDAFCMCGHRDSQHDGEEVCQVNGCMCFCFTEDHSSRPDAVEQAGVADVARPQTIEANPD